ncbi:hypothetical protein ACIPC1_39555 [Streptomyces sp. NPDC087263]|uniref:hypothetical protein n=1 Tax=Streptomyces sp. NPDC087263 TaxID=3365773 RepID=UPI003812B098
MAELESHRTVLMIRHTALFSEKSSPRNKRSPQKKSQNPRACRSETGREYGKIDSMARKIENEGQDLGGPLRGRAQTGRPVSYDPTSGQNWRTGVVIVPDMAAKAIKAAGFTGQSFAGLVNELIRRMPVDEHGRPLWADELDEQRALPLTG